MNTLRCRIGWLKCTAYEVQYLLEVLEFKYRVAQQFLMRLAKRNFLFSFSSTFRGNLCTTCASRHIDYLFSQVVVKINDLFDGCQSSYYVSHWFSNKEKIIKSNNDRRFRPMTCANICWSGVVPAPTGLDTQWHNKSERSLCCHRRVLCITKSWFPLTVTGSARLFRNSLSYFCVCLVSDKTRTKLTLLESKWAHSNHIWMNIRTFFLLLIILPLGNFSNECAAGNFFKFVYVY